MMFDHALSIYSWKRNFLLKGEIINKLSYDKEQQEMDSQEGKYLNKRIKKHFFLSWSDRPISAHKDEAINL